MLDNQINSKEKYRCVSYKAGVSFFQTFFYAAIDDSEYSFAYILTDTDKVNNIIEFVGNWIKKSCFIWTIFCLGWIEKKSHYFAGIPALSGTCGQIKLHYKLLQLIEGILEPCGQGRVSPCLGGAGDSWKRDPEIPRPDHQLQALHHLLGPQVTLWPYPVLVWWQPGQEDHKCTSLYEFIWDRWWMRRWPSLWQRNKVKFVNIYFEIRKWLPVYMNIHHEQA